MDGIVTGAPMRTGAPGKAATVERAPTRRRRQGRLERRGLWFVVPFLVVLTLFMFVPLIYAVYTSVFTTKLIGGTSFSGFSNYAQVLSSSDFWGGVRRVFLFAVIQVPVTIGIAAFFAAIFDLGVAKFGRFFRVVFFIPFAVPAVVAAMMWSFLLLPQLASTRESPVLRASRGRISSLRTSSCPASSSSSSGNLWVTTWLSSTPPSSRCPAMSSRRR